MKKEKRRNRFFLMGVFALQMLSCSGPYEKTDIKSNIPSLEELSGKWVSVDTVDMEPSIRNFQSQALTNPDMSSISWLAAAPYAGGYHSGIFRLNGGVPLVKEFRWQPFQALRKTDFGHFEIVSSTRMPVEKNAVMWNIEIRNRSESAEEVRIEQDLIGFISKYPGDWQWWYPYPKMKGKTTTRDDEVENVRRFIGKARNGKAADVTELMDGRPKQKSTAANWPSDRELLKSNKYNTKIFGNDILVYDTETEAVTGFRVLNPDVELRAFNSGARARLKTTLEGGRAMNFRYVMAYGDEEKQVRSTLESLASDYNRAFKQIEEEWNKRWYSLFEPGNDLLSGTFPVLETKDELARKVYYTGPLTMLYLMHTRLPQHEKVFLTGGPRWGASITFFWDITEWATLWATIDPAMMKTHLSTWIGIDPSKYYGQDNQGGKGVGNGYSANYWALFQMIHAYITISGDNEFLDQKIEGKTVLRHLEHYASNWKRLSVYEKTTTKDDRYRLADFGDDEWNLLECVPTYKHIVPSFNAAYIWMMRQTADFLEWKGETKKAEKMRVEADQMVEWLLQLYAGDGIWYSLYPDGKQVEIRHCLDFMFVGRYLPQDVPKAMKSEMVDFIYKELITDHWMRAQSLNDIAARDSDRPDHGPLGAFDGWPAGTMDALTQLGFPQKALEFYHQIEAVTDEGIWAQAHELWGANKMHKHAKVRIAQRGWHNRESSSGIAMSQVMLKDFFGFYPNIRGEAIQNKGTMDFSGTLYHVMYKGAYYTLKTTKGITTMTKENQD